MLKCRAHRAPKSLQVLRSQLSTHSWRDLGDVSCPLSLCLWSPSGKHQGGWCLPHVEANEFVTCSDGDNPLPHRLLDKH